MLRYAGRRLLQMIPVFFGATLLDLRQWSSPCRAILSPPWAVSAP